MEWPLWASGTAAGEGPRDEAGGWWRWITEGPACTSQPLKGQSTAREEAASDTVKPGTALPLWASVSPFVEWEWGRSAEQADDFQGPFWLPGDGGLSEPPSTRPTIVPDGVSPL